MRRTLSSVIPVNNRETTEFGQRLAEACGSEEPARIARFLNISYQAAKNYLGGRLPEPKVLLRIAENTPYSIHWLLTGDGERFVVKDAELDKPVSASALKDLIKEGCAEVINEVLSRRGEPKVVLLDPSTIKSETLYESERSLGIKFKTPKS